MDNPMAILRLININFQPNRFKFLLSFAPRNFPAKAFPAFEYPSIKNEVNNQIFIPIV